MGECRCESLATEIIDAELRCSPRVVKTRLCKPPGYHRREQNVMPRLPLPTCVFDTYRPMHESAQGER